MINKIIWKILKRNKGLQKQILDNYIKEGLITDKQKSKIISGMTFDNTISDQCLENKVLILNNCLFINSTISQNTIAGDLVLKTPYNCIISNNKNSKEPEPVDIPDFINKK